jgi:hypothetical protein
MPEIVNKKRISLSEDDSSHVVQLTPSVRALAVTVDASVSLSTEIELNSKTTFIRVYAKSQDVYMRWGTADASSTVFDEIIPSGQICDFYVPLGETAVNFIEESSGAKLTVIEK